MAIHFYDKKAKMATAIYEFIGQKQKGENPSFAELTTKMFIEYGFNKKAVLTALKEFGWEIDELEQLKNIHS